MRMLPPRPRSCCAPNMADVYKRQEGHFRHLRDLYEKGELTNAINRVVEDINHRFTLEVLSQDWKSHDLGISASNLRRDRKNPTDILDRIDLAFVTDSLRKLLEIRNRAEQTVALDDVHAADIGHSFGIGVGGAALAPGAGIPVSYTHLIHGIDEYIRYGGTMSLGGVHYNETSTFASKESTDEYVDTAIARNIQHSLRCYQYEGHFRHLRDLYEKGELTSAINRVVEDINHRFTLEVLSQDWKSHDLGISASNLRRDRKNPTDILDRIDLALVTDSLRKLLEIRNRAEQTVALDDVHAAEIKEYLDLLDLTQEIDVLHLPDVSTKSSRTAIAQPGLRYAQADALIRSLLLDETFSALSLAERTAVQQRILTEIKGRMLEDIVLLETKLANPKKQVFVLQFPVGEFDMVVFDPEAGSCRIFEIKHSEETVPQQYRHLIDEQKCVQTEHRYGPITGKFVLYRGKDQVVEGIQYQNVEEYLRSLA